jgi:predicted carbohydrate-binding protein with CBM48
MSEQREDEELTGPLGRATRLLQEEPSPRAEWREAVLQAAERADVRPLGWRVRPAVAIAACAACLIMGAAITYGVLRDRIGSGAHDVVASENGSVRQGQLPVRFAVEAPGAVHVSIVGDFNGWNPVGLPMHRLSDGRTWEVEVGLAPGRYAYAFVVDGRLSRDSSAPESGTDDFGVPNSVVLVGGS